MDKWAVFQRALQQSIGDADFTHWIKPVRFVGFSGDSLILSVPNETFEHVLGETFLPALKEAAALAWERPYTIVLAKAEEPTPKPAPRPSPTLNPAYTFEAFVIGESNQFAHAAARAVAENPAKAYNPLFIYGATGLGKTHLLQAIGNYCAGHHNMQVLYVTVDSFYTDMVNSLKNQKLMDFRQTYRSADLFLLDDVQFLTGKKTTQDELFHLFNLLHEARKQIVLASDHLPKDINELQERLRSRFEGGLLADIMPPGLEMKVAIVKKKAEQDGASMPDDVCLFIARHVRSNIRDLEGLYRRIAAYASFTNQPISLACAQEALQRVLDVESAMITPKEIMRTVAHYYGLKVQDLKSKNSAKPYSFPRQVCMWLIKQLTTLSFPEIGKLFGNKHHSTVIYSVGKIEEMRQKDLEVKKALDELMEQFQ
jgi:chromosomal replication initiator protein